VDAEEAAMSRTELLTGDARDTAADGNLPRIQELVGIFEDLSAEALVRKVEKGHSNASAGTSPQYTVPAYLFSLAHVAVDALTILNVQAIERTEEQGADWTLKHESLVQARADAETIQQLLQQAYNFQQVMWDLCGLCKQVMCMRDEHCEQQTPKGA
jgi:predicted NAD/FAD-dependent oxidoreductase